MGNPTTSEFQRVLAFESAIDRKVCDEVRRESWGSTFLTPSLPLIWDANFVEFEQTGLPMAEVVEIADDVLGGAGCAHRTAAFVDVADGRRVAKELESDPDRWPGWEAEGYRYMIWREDEAPAPTAAETRETTLAKIDGLRRQLLGEEFKSMARREEVIDQLLVIAHRAAAAAGDRWFVAPADGEPVSACCLFQADGIAQVEDVGTRLDSRERGYAKAVVKAAIAVARAAGDTTIFLIADAADWPQLLYSKLGFEPVGDITVLRRRP